MNEVLNCPSVFTSIQPETTIFRESYGKKVNITHGNIIRALYGTDTLFERVGTGLRYVLGDPPNNPHTASRLSEIDCPA